MAYCTGNRGRFPRPATSAQLTEDWIYWQAGRNKNDSPLVPYLGNTFNDTLFQCPSDAELDAHTAKYIYSYTINETMATAAQGLAGVSINGILHGAHGGIVGPAPDAAPSPTTPRTLLITQIRIPADKIMLIDESSTTIDDGCWAPQNYSAAAATPRNLLSNRHDRKAESSSDPNAGRGNAFFSDGHADFIERKLANDPYHWDATWSGG